MSSKEVHRLVKRAVKKARAELWSDRELTGIVPDATDVRNRIVVRRKAKKVDRFEVPKLPQFLKEIEQKS